MTDCQEAKDLDTQTLLDYRERFYKIIDNSKNMDTCRQASEKIKLIEQELEKRKGLDEFL